MFLGFHYAGMEVDENPARNMPPNPHKLLTKQTGGGEKEGERVCFLSLFPLSSVTAGEAKEHELCFLMFLGYARNSFQRFGQVGFAFCGVNAFDKVQGNDETSHIAS